MKKNICLKLWCDWAMLKHYVSRNAKKIMELVEDEGKEDEAMDALCNLAGPLGLGEVDAFIVDKLLDKLKIKNE